MSVGLGVQTALTVLGNRSDLPRLKDIIQTYQGVLPGLRSARCSYSESSRLQGQQNRGGTLICIQRGMPRQRLASRNLGDFTQTKCKRSCAPTDLLWVTWPPGPLYHHSKSGLTLKIADWKSWTYADGCCHIQGGKTVIGAGVYHPSSGNSNLVETNGAGITNTIGRAELAAIAAAITHNHIYIDTDSLTSLHQIRKQLLYPEKHRHNVQGANLKLYSDTIQTLNPKSSFTN